MNEININYNHQKYLPSRSHETEMNAEFEYHVCIRKGSGVC